MPVARHRGTEFRIHSPPAKSQRTIGSATVDLRDTAEIDGRLLEELVAAYTGKNVIAFTHKPVLGGDAVAVENRPPGFSTGAQGESLRSHQMASSPTRTA
jgi:hypothetical protein